MSIICIHFTIENLAEEKNSVEISLNAFPKPKF